MKLLNPFLVRGYCGPEYFCDREKETAQLVDSLVNEGDVTLIAPRRYGKTGLIHNAFRVLPKEYARVYLDIYATRCLADFAREFASAVLGTLETRLEKAARGLAAFFKSCRPTIVPTEQGLPKFSFDVVPAVAEATLKETFDYLAKRERRLVIAIDEFQQVLEYPEKGTEALLRSLMQRLPWVRFVFAGSRQHIMREMFLSPKHPFYQSTDLLSLRPIDREVYCRFAKRFFAARRKPFSETAFRSIYDRFDGVTWYVQMVLRRLWAEGAGIPDAAAANAAVQDIVETRTFAYWDLFNSRSDAEQALLKATAKGGPVAAPLSGDFIARNGLRTASTVASALKRLLRDDLLYRTERGYVVYDRFFGVWLRG